MRETLVQDAPGSYFDDRDIFWNFRRQRKTIILTNLRYEKTKKAIIIKIQKL